MTVEVLEPHGFCAGVRNALAAAERLAEKSGGKTVYCLHEIVHNEIVVDGLRRRGFKFVDAVSDVPDGAVLLLSAHGVAPSVRAEAAARGIGIVDATCPFVAKVHAAARSFAERGLPVVVVGKASHAEVAGIVGEAPGAFVVGSVRDAEAMDLASPRIGVVSQTTMNADEVAEIVAALSRRFEVETAAEVCFATKERQDAVKAFDGDALLVLGSASSSNTARLCEVSRAKRVFRAGTLDEVSAIDFSGASRLGVTSGASTPESFLSSALSLLRR